MASATTQAVLKTPSETENMETTIDAFHNGAFSVVQPKNDGHRSGMDALLLAAAVPENARGVLADIGSGAGVAGLAALNLNREIDLLEIENNPMMADLAQASLNLPENRELKKRARIIEADVTASARDREAAGLEPNLVSHSIMNPPYNPVTLRVSSDPVKAAAHQMGEGGLDCWFRAAAAITKPGGTLCLIYRTQQLGDILACTQGRFGGLEILPIHSRRNEPAKRLIARGTRGSRAPLSIAPGFVVHEDDGSFTSEAQSIFEGTGRLAFSDG